MRSFCSKAICLLLVFLMSFVTSCSHAINSGVSVDHTANTSSSHQETTSRQETRTEKESISTGIIEPPTIEDDVFEEYDFNEAEAFIYNLIYSDLSVEYDTFTGYIALPDDQETEIYGIGYSDYEEGYLDADNHVFFSAGFIRFASEPDFDVASIQSGLEVHSLDESDDVYSYVYAYSTQDIHKHCVVDGKYVKYDIVDGMLQYSEENYYPGMDVELSRGNIYNYDTCEYDYIVETTDYIPVTGVSLIGDADYQAIIDEVNRILTTQEANLTYQEIESFVAQSQEALYSYLLGLQEETFMGIPTIQLVEIVRNLDPMQHLRIGVDDNGNTTIHIIEVTKLATLWEKIATSLVCAFGIVSGVLLTTINPALAGALIGASMEAFSQVVINNTPVSDIQWAQMAVAAACGSISGAITGALGSWGANVIVKEVIDTVCDGIIGGGEFFINALIAGQSFEEACQHFGYGMLTAVLISGGVKVAKAIVKGGVRLVNKIESRMVESIGDTQVTKLSKEAVENEVIKKTAKGSVQDAVGKFSDSNPKLRRWSGAGRITVSQFEDADFVRRSIAPSTELGSHIDNVTNNHFDASRPIRVPSKDSAFINANRVDFVNKVSKDFQECKIYLKEVTDYSKPGEHFIRYGYFVKDSQSLEGVLLSNPSQTTRNYRVLIDVFDDGRTIIYDAYPEFRYIDFYK